MTIYWLIIALALISDVFWLLCCFRGWWFVGEPLNPNV